MSISVCPNLVSGNDSKSLNPNLMKLRDICSVTFQEDEKPTDAGEIRQGQIWQKMLEILTKRHFGTITLSLQLISIELWYIFSYQLDQKAIDWLGYFVRFPVHFYSENPFHKNDVSGKLKKFASDFNLTLRYGTSWMRSFWRNSVKVR